MTSPPCALMKTLPAASAADYGLWCGARRGSNPQDFTVSEHGLQDTSQRPAVLHGLDGDRHLIPGLERIFPIACRKDDVRRLTFRDPLHDLPIFAFHFEPKQTVGVGEHPFLHGAFQRDLLPRVERRAAMVRGQGHRQCDGEYQYDDRPTFHFALSDFPDAVLPKSLL